ncbi:MAG: SURF1 family protein [Longimicrobiales bacterium]
MDRTDGERPPLQITRAGIAGTIVVLIVAAVCVRLGIWQLDRLGQRRERNAALESRMALPALAVARVVADSAGLTFRRARAEGTFDDAHTIVLPGRSYQGVPGVHLLTPLVLPDASGALLVNRGWVPAADAATVDFEALETAGDTAVEGILLPFPGHGASLAPGSTAASDSSFRRVWFAIDESALRAQFPYPLGEVELQLLPGTDRAHIPRAVPPPALDEGPHRGYAIQWFSFATIAIVGWIALLLNRERGVRDRD